MEGYPLWVLKVDENIVIANETTKEWREQYNGQTINIVYLCE